jgi:hypothetical protein
VLGEFGDTADRYADARSRSNYAGTSPVTRASGTKRSMLARHARNLRALANRLVGILDGCLRHHTTHNEDTTTQNVELRAA